MFYQSVGLEGLLHKEYSYAGKERILKSKSKNGFIVLKDNYGSYRIIYTIENKWVGCLQVMVDNTRSIASNIFVLEEHRRNGISGIIIKYAYKMFPDMIFSTSTNYMSRGMVEKYKK